MFSFHKVTLTVPDSSWRVAVATWPGPNFVLTSLGFSMSTILPLTSTRRIPGFSSAILICVLSERLVAGFLGSAFASTDNFAGRETVPDCGNSHFYLFSLVCVRDEDHKIVYSGYPVSASSD